MIKELFNKLLALWQGDKIRNTGLLDLGPQEGDWRAGAASGILYEIQNESGDWRTYLPSNEKQNFIYFDAFNCTSYAGLNSVEIQINKLLSEKKVDRALIADWLDAQGRFEGSDRFSGIASGNTRQGNYMVNVPEAFRKVGILPEKYLPHPTDEKNFFWNDYYSDPDIEKHKEIALKFLNYFSVAYEWVPTDRESLKKHLKQAPIVLLTPLCKGFFTDNPVKTCDLNVPAHATVLTHIDQYNDIYDSYVNYSRALGADYPIIYAMKILITPKIINNTIMKWCITPDQNQYRLDEELKIAYSIPAEADLKLFQSRGLKGQPEYRKNLDGYAVYSTIQTPEAKKIIDDLKDRLNA